MSRHWRWFIPGLVWIAILTILGLFVARFVYKAKGWRLRGLVIECVGGAKWRMDPNTGKRRAVSRIWGRPGAQTWGGLVIYATETQRKRVPLRVHELCHVAQAMFVALVGAIVAALGHLWTHGFELDFALAISVNLGGVGGALMFAALYGAHFLARYGWVRLQLCRRQIQPNASLLFLNDVVLEQPGVRAVRFYELHGRVEAVIVGGDLAKVEKALRDAGNSRGGFLARVRIRARRPWWAAYRWVWAEVEAYERQAEFEAGTRPDVWGA